MEDEKILEIIKSTWPPIFINNGVGYTLHLSVEQYKIIDKIIRGPNHEFGIYVCLFCDINVNSAT